MTLARTFMTIAFTAVALLVLMPAQAAEPAPRAVWCRDADGDGFGSPYDMVEAEVAPAGYIADCSDCDDRFDDINPLASELCDGLDNDCDGAVDQDWPQAGTPCLVGLGICQRGGVLVCRDDGLGLECGAVSGIPEYEICDGLDNDCDGEVDEAWPLLGQICPVGIGGCQSWGNFMCDPGDPSGPEVCSAVPWPPSEEICDCVDNDCDGVIDEECVTAVGDGSQARRFQLESAAPNPFNPMTVISFSLAREGAVRLRILDVSGRLVRTLVDGKRMPAGRHSVRWDGRDEEGRTAASGVYLCGLEAGGRRSFRRLAMIR